MCQAWLYLLLPKPYEVDGIIIILISMVRIFWDEKTEAQKG